MSNRSFATEVGVLREKRDGWILKPMNGTPRPWLALVAFAGLLGACAATPASPPPPPAPVPVAEAPTDETGSEAGGGEAAPAPTPTPEPDPEPPMADLPSFSPSGNVAMDAWRLDFAGRAIASGRDVDVVYATLKDIRPLTLYLGDELNAASTGIADQAEFAKPIWEYVEDAVTESRKTRGAGKLAEFESTFAAIEAAYGVDREAITAIWAMETNLGAYIGTFDAANTLSNMAVEGRRRSFAERELTALMQMQERGEVRRDQLISGWAGAMGQTQFMPSTFLAYAVDFDGDGVKDLWQSEADALASAANYLSASGYQNDQPWGIEVLAPENFNWALADGQDRRISTWKQAGLSPIAAPEFSVGDGQFAELWLPTGATGPKFLLFKNFDAYKTYNRSDSYALAVGLLTDGVAGRHGPIAAWPTHLGQLNRRDVMLLQDTLNQLGFDAGPVDGIAGRGTKAALRSFQSANGLIADGYPTRQALDYVLAAAS
ncbi:MAG: lytic murein transglycosylase [Henriciella sp.]|nr:lytic murein transglycosylase [Henriciella sp.]